MKILMENTGAEALFSAIAVCVATAIIKKNFGEIKKREMTLIEFALSFAAAAAVAFFAKKGDMSGIVAGGLSTAGVAMTVCGLFCGGKGGNGEGESNNAQAAKVLLDAAKGEIDEEKLTRAITEISQGEITEEEAAVMATLIKKASEET